MTRSEPAPTRGTRGYLLGLLLLGTFSGCASTPKQEALFEQHDIVLAAAKHQIVVTGFLLGGPIADVAVVSVAEGSGRTLRIHSSGEDWAPKIDASLRPGAQFVDVARIAGRDRLIVFASGRLSWFDPESRTEKDLVMLESRYTPPVKTGMSHVDITHDVNHDGRDDLVVPDVDGFWVLVQSMDGCFADPLKLGPPADTIAMHAAEGYRHDPWAHSRIHEADFDGDGRMDLVFWKDTHFEVHLQDGQGLFSPSPGVFTTGVTFDTDNIAMLAAPHGVRRRRHDHNPDGEIDGRALHTIGDLDGDGVPDLAVFSLAGGSLWKMRSAWEIHRGTRAADGSLRFSTEVSTAVRTRGIPFAVELHDLGDDGQMDFLITTIKPGLFKAIGMIVVAFVTKSVALDLDIYRMENRAYSERPTIARKVKSRTASGSGERTSFPSVLVGDATGDGQSDLLVAASGRKLEVFSGVSGADLFESRPTRVPVIMPDREEYTWLVDANRDGKRDLVVHHPSTTEPHRVTLLIAR